MMNSPDLKEQLATLILAALHANYTSFSSKDATQTGNHYQSIQLGEMRTAGFRSDRSEVLDRIDFREKKVLDLGSNLGELSRGARARGAALVDGFEYDPYFIQIANLINAHNDVTRVSFYQRDITDRAVYHESYDIVMAFSVFFYIQPLMSQIATCCRQTLILETHKLEGNLETSYLAPVLPYFPHYRILAESDWGTNYDQSQGRAIIVFARHERTFDTLFAPALVSAVPEG